MTPLLTEAWYLLTALVLTVIACVIIGLTWCWMGGLLLLGIFAVPAMFTPAYFRRARRAGKVVMDERDREIDRRATVAGWLAQYTYLGVALISAALWLVLIPASTAKWDVQQYMMDRPTVSPELVLAFLVGAIVICYTARAIAIVLLYRRM